MNIDQLRVASQAEAKVDVLAELRRITTKPGIYFGMPEAHYHADPSVGSSNLRTMHKSMRAFQAESWMTAQEDRSDRGKTEATILGSALHKIVLEGVEEFTRKYVRRSSDYENMSPSEKSALTKATKAMLKPGQEMLDFYDYKLCVDAARLIVDHKDLRLSLSGGCNEVSVFWIDVMTGIPCKARYDRLREAGIGDIKTMANQYSMRMEQASLAAIQNMRYDLQAAHYLDGRMALKKLIEDQQIVHVTTPTAAEMKLRNDLCNGVRKTIDFAFQFIFLDKSQADVWSGIYSPQNPIIRSAAEWRTTLLDKYRQLLMLHGAQKWPHEWRLGEIHPEDHPYGDRGWR